MALTIEDFCKERKCQLLKAFPQFLIHHEREGKGYLHLDKGSSYYINFDSNFSDYCRKLDVDLWSVLDGYIDSSKERVTVADVGCGQGRALQEVKARYGSNVFVIGFELIPLITHHGLDQLVVRNFEEDPLPNWLNGSVDLVVSDQVFRYFLHPFGKPYENVLRMLAPGGKAFIDVFACELPGNRDSYTISQNKRLTIMKSRL